MKRSLLCFLLVTLIVPASAMARHRKVVAPPGNSGISQYVESIPTAGGNQPTSSVHGGGGGGGGGGSNNGGGGGTGAGGSAISPSTASSLASQGADGRSAAALARATTPGGSSGASGGSGGSGSGHRGAKNANLAPGPVPTSSGISPASAVIKALTGSSSGGGLGTLLPVILIASLLGVSALALMRRRRPT